MKKQETLLISALVVLGVLTRTIFHLGANIEFVTASSLVATFFVKDKRKVFIVPVLIMLISDLILGNSAILLFTWSGFLFIPILGMVANSRFFKRKLKQTPEWIKYLVLAEFAGIISTVIFFLWTNLGVVLTTSMYPKTLSGLLLSYEMAIPFLRNQLYANIVIVPAIMLITYLGVHYFKNDKYTKHFQQAS